MALRRNLFVALIVQDVAVLISLGVYAFPDLEDELFVWVTLELRFRTLVGDIPMDLVSLGSTFATSSSIYIALARSSAVCSSCTGSMTDVGVVGLVYLSSLWQVEEKFIVIFRPWNVDVAGSSVESVFFLNISSYME
ncbi:hypothetical protein DY000_02044685 [Brassica cretica]|uniref:Uncharacterized protein n=1 Tax=Brassica cretica TaxID=69181 RepID=A0ABQ7F3I7_BRACR|nr:hypothetical protein DY000_02044685 [Brassica cretica]